MDIGKNNSQTGFTLMEIIISLVIVAVSMTAFIKLLGNSTMLRSKVNDYDERVVVANTKVEEAFLGLLDDKHIQDDGKAVWQGKTVDSGINWRIEKEKDVDAEGNEKDIYFYTVYVDGIEMSSVTAK